MFGRLVLSKHLIYLQQSVLDSRERVIQDLLFAHLLITSAEQKKHLGYPGNKKEVDD